MASHRCCLRPPSALLLLLQLPVLLAAGACAAAGDRPDRRPPATATARALEETLASTRANLAALGGAGSGGGASPNGPGPAAGAGVGSRPSPPPPPFAPQRAEPVAAAFDTPPPRPARPAVAGGAPPPAEAGQLMGLAAEIVTRWLGEPTLRRPEGPAEIWLYTAAACALDLILYRDAAAAAFPGGDGTLRVAFAAARATGAERRSEAACLREIAGGAPEEDPVTPRAAATAAEAGSDAPRPGRPAEGGGAPDSRA